MRQEGDHKAKNKAREADTGQTGITMGKVIYK